MKGVGLELLEEALILRAQADGIEVLRRPDASPAAVVGVVGAGGVVSNPAPDAGRGSLPRRFHHVSGEGVDKPVTVRV
jgi:hypothetical protein